MHHPHHLLLTSNDNDKKHLLSKSLSSYYVLTITIVKPLINCLLLSESESSCFIINIW